MEQETTQMDAVHSEDVHKRWWCPAEAQAEVHTTEQVRVDLEGRLWTELALAVQRLEHAEESTLDMSRNAEIVQRLTSAVATLAAMAPSPAPPPAPPPAQVLGLDADAAADTAWIAASECGCTVTRASEIRAAFLEKVSP